jgi:tetratricopeptide (TPR) repeat protein
MNDPRVLIQQARVLIRHVLERDVNTLEYWGENPRTQAQLRPIAQTIVKLLDKASKAAEKQSDEVANQLTGLDDPRAAISQELSTLATAAAYEKAMSDYYVALSIDKSDPRRKEIATAATDFLAEFDNPQSEVQPLVRNRMAKLFMLAGNYDKARALFDSVADGTDVTPPPDVAMQYEARYFAAVCDVLARKPDAALKSLANLVAWQKGTLKDERSQKGAAAAAAMLEYRIHSLAATMATDDAAKKAANEKAVKVLLALVRERPELQGIIFEQIAGRLPDNPDVKTLDPLLLQAMVRRGEDERLKPDDQPIDKPVIERAIAAARELIARKGKGGVDEKTVETSTLLVAFFLDKLDRPADAAVAFLNFVQQYPKSANAKLALDNAQALVARLRKEAIDDPATIKAYETFLSVAIGPPFNRTEFAFEWARRLQLNAKYADAVEFYRKVPDEDPRKLSARFYEMVALQQQLDTPSTAGIDRPRIVNEVQRLAADVGNAAKAQLAAAQNDKDKLAARSLLVRTTLLAADVARREQKDPKRTLELLADFEKQAEGLPNQADLLGSVLFARVQSHMALGQNNEATDTLVRLLKTMPGGEGATIVFNLLEKLNADLDKARAAGDVEQMKVLANNRAQLSGFLVDWARTNGDENIRKFTYRYSVSSRRCRR